MAFMGSDITSMAWLKSNTMLNYLIMMISFLHIKSNRCIIYHTHFKSWVLGGWCTKWIPVNDYILLPMLPIISMMNMLMRSINKKNYQPLLLSSLMRHSDSLVRDGADVTVLQKQKQQPVKKKPTRWSALEWRRQLHIDPNEFWQVIFCITLMLNGY
jgi:hypothetical protein